MQGRGGGRGDQVPTNCTDQRFLGWSESFFPPPNPSPRLSPVICSGALPCLRSVCLGFFGRNGRKREGVRAERSHNPPCPHRILKKSTLNRTLPISFSFFLDPGMKNSNCLHIRIPTFHLSTMAVCSGRTKTGISFLPPRCSEQIRPFVIVPAAPQSDPIF